jgi:hypothetical protein
MNNKFSQLGIDIEYINDTLCDLNQAVQQDDYKTPKSEG